MPQADIGPGSQRSGALTAEAQETAAGDIPDNQVFLTFRNVSGGYSMKFPEGWAQRGGGAPVTFQDKNNLVLSMSQTWLMVLSDMASPGAGKSHLVIMFTVGPDHVAEGDRIFASHGEWMKGHPRGGDVALLDYTISKGPELSNPLDPSSEPTGRTIFVLDEYYESPAGIACRMGASRQDPPW